jgi:GTPase
MNVVDVGVNWFLKGHSSKFTLDYQNRPFYVQEGTDYLRNGRRSQVVLQYQIFF